MKRYIPSSLRKTIPLEKKEEKWGIGSKMMEEGIGMHHGPFETEEEALEIVGEVRWRIYHFQTNGVDKKIWRWSTKEDCWISLIE